MTEREIKASISSFLMALQQDLWIYRIIHCNQWT